MSKAIIVHAFDLDDEIDESKEILEELRECKRKLCTDLEHAQLTKFNADRRAQELVRDIEGVDQELEIAVARVNIARETRGRLLQ